MLTAAIIFNASFGVFHLLFWRLFNWPASLAGSGRINVGITQVLNLCLTFVFFAIAAGLAMSAPQSAIAKPILLAGGVFWAFRAILQPIYFPIRPPVSLALLALFVLGSIIHWLAFIEA